MRRGMRLLFGGGMVVVLALLAVGGTAVGVDSPRAAPAVGAEFVISGAGATGADGNPAVVWNSTADQYLVVFEDSRRPSGPEIYGQRFAGDGSTRGVNF